jgi:hypothetical protein
MMLAPTNSKGGTEAKASFNFLAGECGQQKKCSLYTSHSKVGNNNRKT